MRLPGQSNKPEHPVYVILLLFNVSATDFWVKLGLGVGSGNTQALVAQRPHQIRRNHEEH
jgi:hypothetical protein